jgi:alkylhydroperoxidase family enzyme
MLLPDVQNYLEPGPHADGILSMQKAGNEYPQIWHLFAFRPGATEHLGRFTQEIMRGEAPLAPALRELIAAFTSQGNNCPF